MSHHGQTLALQRDMSRRDSSLDPIMTLLRHTRLFSAGSSFRRQVLPHSYLPEPRAQRPRPAILFLVGDPVASGQPPGQRPPGHAFAIAAGSKCHCALRNGTSMRLHILDKTRPNPSPPVLASHIDIDQLQLRASVLDGDDPDDGAIHLGDEDLLCAHRIGLAPHCRQMGDFPEGRSVVQSTVVSQFLLAHGGGHDRDYRWDIGSGCRADMGHVLTARHHSGMPGTSLNTWGCGTRATAPLAPYEVHCDRQAEIDLRI